MAYQVNVRAGAVAPETCTIRVSTIANGVTVEDGEDVESVDVVLRRPDGTTVEATLLPTVSSATSVTVAWEFNADGTDIPVRGVGRFTCTLQPSGRRCEPIAVNVRPY